MHAVIFAGAHCTGLKPLTVIVPDVEFVRREPGPRHPAGHRQEAGLGPAAVQLGRAGGHGRGASQVLG